jgi:hypothetical protein
VFSNRKWQQIALILNLAGTALLFYSFQATSSDFRLVTATTHSVMGEFHQYALCVNNYTVVETDSQHGIRLGQINCPDWAHSKPAAVVNIEHPTFVGIGFIILLAGFLLQYLSIPQAKTMAQLRAELKAARMTDRHKS